MEGPAVGLHFLQLLSIPYVTTSSRLFVDMEYACCRVILLVLSLSLLLYPSPSTSPSFFYLEFVSPICIPCELLILPDSGGVCSLSLAFPEHPQVKLTSPQLNKKDAWGDLCFKLSDIEVSIIHFI